MKYIILLCLLTLFMLSCGYVRQPDVDIEDSMSNAPMPIKGGPSQITFNASARGRQGAELQIWYDSCNEATYYALFEGKHIAEKGPNSSKWKILDSSAVKKAKQDILNMPANRIKQMEDSL